MAKPSQERLLKEKNRITALKAKFEKSFFATFKTWQKSVYREFVEQIGNRAPIPVISPELKSRLNELLIAHYLSVAETFAPGIDFSNKKNAFNGDPLTGTDVGVDPSEEEEDDFLILALLRDIENSVSDQIDNNLHIHSSSILNTTSLLGIRAYRLAISEGIPYGSVLAKLLAGHTTTVSITETEWIAEATRVIALEFSTPLTATANQDQLKELRNVSPNITLKDENIDELFLAPPIVLENFRRLLSLPEKTWMTVGDKRVRASHRLAQGQTVKINQPFILTGGLLLFPGDSSLGVSFLEIVNCRCTAVYY